MKRLLLLFAIPLTAFAQHKATTVVQIHPAIPLTGVPLEALKNADYLKSEFEAIVAPETLKAAAIDLYSGKKVDLKHAIKDLKKRISTKTVRGTDFIEITADGKTKEEAIKMSNAVTDAFIKRRTSAEKKRAEQLLKELDNELVKQSKLVEGHRKELTKLIQQYGIPYFDGGNPSLLGKTDQEMFKNAKNKLAEFNVMRDQIEIQVNKLAALTDDKLFVYAAGLDLPQNKIAEYYVQYQEARTEKLALFDQGLNHKHPKIKAAGARAKKSLKSAQKEVVTLKAILKTKLELVNRQVERMGQILDQRDQDPIDLSLRQQKYTEAKDNYEQARTMLREMKIKLQETRVLLKMRWKPVTIHERAK